MEFTTTPKQQDPKIAVPLFVAVGWAFISTVFRALEWPGPQIFADVFKGVNPIYKVLFIPIPEWITNILYHSLVGYVGIWNLLTLAMGVTALLGVIASSNRDMFIKIAMLLAAVHALVQFLSFIEFMTPKPLSIIPISQTILGSSTIVCPLVLITTIGKLDVVKIRGG